MELFTTILKKHILYKNRELLSKTSQEFLELKKTIPSYSLTDNGIKEMLYTKNNEKMEMLINQDNIVLTAFNKNSIESGLVLLCNLKNTSNFKLDIRRHTNLFLKEIYTHSFGDILSR